MAQSKNITVSMQYQNNANSPTSVSFTAEPEVSGSSLVVGHHNERPGVFTAGTPAEGYTTNVRESGSV